MIKRFFLFLFFLVIGGYFLGAQTITDSRDSQVYDTVKVGDQYWMAENLNYGVGVFSWCYRDTFACEDYGRLYSWHVLDSICPSGWHVSTDSDWNILESYLGGSDTVSLGYRNEDSSVGLKLKDDSTFVTGTDVLGLNIKAGGMRFAGSFRGYKYNTGYWTSDSTNAYNGLARYFYYRYDGISRKVFPRSYGLYVRCVKDE